MEFPIKLKRHVSQNLLDIPSFCRVSLLAKNKYNLKNAAVFFQYNLGDRNSIYFQWSSLPLDIIEFAIFKTMTSKGMKHLLIFVKFPFEIKVLN